MQLLDTLLADIFACCGIVAVRLGVSCVLGTIAVHQICICPDYVLVPERMRDEVAAKFQHYVQLFYPDMDGPTDSYGQIVNQRHWDRLAGMLSEEHGGEVLTGGLEGARRELKYIPPTVVLEPRPSSKMLTVR